MTDGMQHDAVQRGAVQRDAVQRGAIQRGAIQRDSILVINAGSSSIKFYLYDIGPGDELTPRLGGQVEGIGTSHPRLRARDAEGKIMVERGIAPSHAADVPNAQEVVGMWLSGHLTGVPIAVGHRVVHGGPELSAPVLIDDDVLARLESFTSLAPLHQPNNLAPIKVIRERRPGIAQVACFDTAFHRSHDALADHYALPERFYEEGVRRYGFHGLSYEYLVQRLGQTLPEVLPGKIVAAHLGNGVSACAIHNGRSVDSTMGFTALEGLPMGTRPGRLDPGIVLWMMEQGMSHDEIEHLLYHDCGLKGLSGMGNDVRELLESDSPRARLALDYFAWRVAEGIAGLGCAMNGIDTLVFTAGIGENAAPIRAAICERLGWLGIAIDAERNAHHGPRISTGDSRVGVYVVRTNEELVIAQHTLALVRGR
ncbi:acetate/propionate family kinase [Bordetella genomosp. 5]|uniref:acetate/propionate family kinase n=1 Tax=Bordetella genomosp. 5 TaxID=1395608 RepID=UPI0020CCF1FF|nr:acetate kinase [Bordetella genomosp. 5]